MKQRRKGLEWLLKHTKAEKLKLELKEISHHPNLKLLLDNNFKPSYDDGRMTRLERENPHKNGEYEFVIYDLTLHKYEHAYIDGHFHHGSLIAKYIPIEKK